MKSGHAQRGERGHTRGRDIHKRKHTRKGNINGEGRDDIRKKDKYGVETTRKGNYTEKEGWTHAEKTRGGGIYGKELHKTGTIRRRERVHTEKGHTWSGDRFGGERYTVRGLYGMETIRKREREYTKKTYAVKRLYGTQDYTEKGEGTQMRHT